LAKNTSNRSASSSGASFYGEYSLDASRSSFVYGNSDTVQPKSLVGQWLIVAFGTVSNVGNADVANVMQAVERVQTGLGKVDGITDYIIESYRNGTEWYEIYKSGKVRQGGEKSVKSDSVNVALLKPFADKNYSVRGAVAARVAWSIQKESTTQIALRTDSSTGYAFSWVAEGQGA
jgi:hypothetical protein